jgi:hypothetical protein
MQQQCFAEVVLLILVKLDKFSEEILCEQIHMIKSKSKVAKFNSQGKVLEEQEKLSLPWRSFLSRQEKLNSNKN